MRVKMFYPGYLMERAVLLSEGGALCCSNLRAERGELVCSALESVRQKPSKRLATLGGTFIHMRD